MVISVQYWSSVVFPADWPLNSRLLGPVIGSVWNVAPSLLALTHFARWNMRSSAKWKAQKTWYCLLASSPKLVMNLASFWHGTLSLMSAAFSFRPLCCKLVLLKLALWKQNSYWSAHLRWAHSCTMVPYLACDRRTFTRSFDALAPTAFTLETNLSIAMFKYSNASCSYLPYCWVVEAQVELCKWYLS